MEVVFILIAKRRDGTTILSTKLQREELKRMREKESFFCPQCQALVSLKVGQVVTPHFAHRPTDTCTALFSEGESELHLKGKQQLYDFFHRKKVEVELEPYMKRLAQRPDILVKHGRDLFPVEFQCSPMPFHEKKSRTEGYKRAGLHPLWILRTPEKYKNNPPSVSLFRFSKFEESFFLNPSPEGSILLTYDPHFERFHYFSSLLHVTGHQYIGTHRILSITDQTIPFARPKLPTDEEMHRYVLLYKEGRSRFLKSRIFFNRKGVNDPFLRACYELRISLENLPPWIGIPVSFGRSFQEHAAVWQLLLVYFMKLDGIRLSQLTDAKIRCFVNWLGEDADSNVKACMAYRDFLLTHYHEKLQTIIDLDDQLIARFLKTTIVAMEKES